MSQRSCASADQVHDTGPQCRGGEHRAQGLADALQAIGDCDQDVGHAARLQVVEGLHTERDASLQAELERPGELPSAGHTSRQQADHGRRGFGVFRDEAHRDWGQPSDRYKLAAGGPDDPIFHWTVLPHQRAVVGKGNQAQMWNGHWLNASALLDLWPSRQDLDEFMVDGVHQDTKRQRRKPLSWWAWQATDGNLQFGVYRRAPGWVAAPRTGKTERRADLVERYAAQQRRLAQIVSEPAITRDADG